MKIALIACVALSLVLPLAGCAQDKMPEAARKALEQADALELVSLHPGHEEAEAASDKEKFNGWKRLGQTTLEGEETIQPLVAAFIKGVNENDGRVAGCFNPRNGIMVTHGEDVHEFVICFECYQVQWFVNGEEKDGFLITDSPQPAFNKILKQARVPLPPRH